ncbi:MAG: phospholipid carrier-dependent glycosyltransferase [Candidatus Pacebacteria bacterium]|nr:phospholipid carrier-dependent glycosyltransferase [Candidatus Paceibacterota bacterium]
MKKFFLKYHYLLLVLVISFTFFSRIIRLHVPERYVFDEVYHALTSKLIARNDVRAYEWWNKPVEKDTAVDWLHPPYAKYTQAFFIKMYGENSFGWRISSVIFGVLVIMMVYKLSLELFEDKNLSLLATLLASLDGLLLVQSRIAMNDIHVTFFILLTLLLYVRYKKYKKLYLLLLTGLSAGLAIGTKWSGVFALLTVGFFESIHYLQLILKRIKEKKFNNKIKNNIANFFAILNLKYFSILFFSLIILPLSMYLLSYSHMFIQGKSLICLQQESIRGECYFERIQLGEWKWEGYISHFAELHRQIWWYQTNLEATHSYQSRPYQWFLNLKPVWIHVDYQKDKIANIYSQGNSVLFWIGDIAVATTLLTYLLSYTAKIVLFISSKVKLFKKVKKIQLMKRLAKIKLPKYLGFLIFAYFAVWLPWQLSPRIMFFYHYTPAIPLLSIILAYWLTKVADFKLKKFNLGKVIVTTVIILSGLNFIVFYPNWTAIPVDKDWANNIYFAIKSWK